MHYDHIVVGAGSMGMAAGYFLARQGKKVLLLDAFQPPHTRGSHHGETRLIRLAYGEGKHYVPFILRAYELWKELESLSEKEIFRQVGILNFAPTNDSFIHNIVASSKQYQLPIELLSAKEANKRWSGIRLHENMVACYEPTSGILFSEHIIEAYYKLAIQAGATIIGDNRVIDIEPNQEIVTITAESSDVFTANSVVISVGAWAKKMFEQLRVDVPVQPIRKTFAWYEADEAIYSDRSFPGFTYTNGRVAYYGFPSIDGVGVKIGRHDLGEDVDPDEKSIPFGEVRGDQEDLDDFLRTYLPKVGPLQFGKTCMYTMSPDSNFIIDTLPDYPNIVIATGFSGHGFKFASAVGEALKDLLLQKETNVDLRSFSLERFKR